MRRKLSKQKYERFFFDEASSNGQLALELLFWYSLSIAKITFTKRRFLDLSPLRFVSKRFHILDVLSSGQVKDVAVVSAEVETAKLAPFHRNWFAAVNKNI